MDILNQIFIHPTLNVAIFFYKLFEAANFPYPLAFAILALTILIKIIVWPLTAKQLHQTRKMAELKPHLDELKKKHGKDKTIHSQKQSELYKAHGVNPATGCLMLLIQLPIFFSLYQVLTKVVSAGSPGEAVNQINQSLYFGFLHLTQPLDASFLGVQLFTKPADWQSAGVLLLLVPVVTAVFQLVQSKMMILKSVKGKAKKDPNKKEDLADSIMQAQSQMTYILPLLIGYFSYTLPIGLSLYWNIFSVFGIVQQYLIMGWGSLADWLPFLRTKSQNKENDKKHNSRK